MAIPAIPENPPHREPMAPPNPVASPASAAAIERCARRLRHCFELAAAQAHSTRVETSEFFAAFLTAQIRQRHARNRRHVTAVVLMMALVETFDFETLDDRRYLVLKPSRPEESSAEGEDAVDTRRPRTTPRTHRRRIIQKKLPRNTDITLKVAECYRGELGHTWVNFYRKRDEEKLRLIIQKLNSVKLRECKQYSKGFLCAALNSEVNGDVLNEQFIRAVVLGRGRDENFVKIRSLDFNFEDEVEKTSLRYLPRKLRRIPPLAYNAVVVNTDRRDHVARELQASTMIESEETLARVLRYHEKGNFYEVYVHERRVDDAGFQVG